MDQIKQDESWTGVDLDAETLLYSIIEGLWNQTLEWPWPEDRLISQDEWIEKTMENPSFYKEHATSVVDFQSFEAILLDLASQFLKRRILLIPFIVSPDTLPTVLPYGWTITDGQLYDAGGVKKERMDWLPHYNSNFVDDIRGPLPEGWFEQLSKDGLNYFVDLNNRKTQWKDPRTGLRSSSMHTTRSEQEDASLNQKTERSKQLQKKLKG